MSNLRTLLGFDPVKYTDNKIYVYNTDIENQMNGGRCCCWVVPAGITYARFEIFGSGGSGAGGCCCQQPAYGAGTGTWVTKSFPVTVGTAITICAGSSGCCTQQCCGVCGTPSFVLCNGQMCGCAPGGRGGNTECWHAMGSYTCCWSWIENCGNGDYGEASVNSSVKGSQYCHHLVWATLQGAPWYGSTRKGLDHCSGPGFTKTGLCFDGCHSFPSGPGGNGSSCGGGCCWGQEGGGGLVIVTFT